MSSDQLTISTILHLLEKFANTKGVIISRKLKDKQYKGQTKKDDLQNITQKTKYRAAPTPPETGGDLRCSSRVSSSCSTRGTRRVDCMQ